MRLSGQAKGGYFPVPPEVVRQMCRWLQPEAEGICILDPCCGAGDALAAFAEELRCDPANVYGIEIELGRAEESKGRIPGATILGPADFLATKITKESFGFIWLNPPFDDEIGGGDRTEAKFLRNATRLLPKDGVIAFMTTEDVWDRWRADEWKSYVAQHYDVMVLEAEDALRPFGEIVVLGKRRAGPNTYASYRDIPKAQPLADVTKRFTIPATTPPKRFEKAGLTPQEIELGLAQSPLGRLTEAGRPRELPRPPLQLGRGHIAMLLASGDLDGEVELEGEAPHVVRGTATKKQELVSEEERDGTTRSVYIDVPVLVVRTANRDGEIVTLTNGGADESD